MTAGSGLGYAEDMRIIAVLVLLMLSHGAPVDAGSPRRACVAGCDAAIAACAAVTGPFGIAPRLCRTHVLRRCKREGVASCTVTTSSTTSSTTSTTSTLPGVCGPYGERTCGGPCPNGYVCGLLGGTLGLCHCVTDPAWRFPCTGGSGFPTCDGTCPGTLTCQPESYTILLGDGGCVCVPSAAE